MPKRHYSPLDQFITQFDSGLRAIFGSVTTTERANPADDTEEAELSHVEQDLAGRLMRINHAGEVAAQGLYQGQALTAKLPKVREQMERAALEENDHLAWCRKRAQQLGTHTSVLDPLWYIGSVAIGAAAGAAGDHWSLGFVAETERQVVRHLDAHLAQLAENDQKSRRILEQMKADEGQHATIAVNAGGKPLPEAIKKAMRLTSKIMTRTAYWI